MTKNCAIILFIIFFAVKLSYAQNYSGGSGTSENPYQIASKTDLKYLSDNSADWSKHFIQIADIIFTDADFQSGGDFYYGGSFFSPIGNNSVKFTGSYNGNNYKISNLKINRYGTLHIGFFGYTGASVVIENLGLENATILGGDKSGGLVGWNLGTISECFADVDINATTYVGGLVGNNAGMIQRSYSSGSVIGGNRLGGLVGVNEGSGSIINSYSSAAVTANFAQQNMFGGLVGYNSSTINNCYAIGVMNVTIKEDGGLVGAGDTSKATNSFWDVETTGLTKSAGGTGKTTAEMKTPATYVDWDFENIWQINGIENDGYPFLQSVSLLPVELTSFTASLVNNDVILNWQTATEVNNYGFEIERQSLSNEQSHWEKIGFVKGNGNSNSPKSYEFVDTTPQTSEVQENPGDFLGRYLYRLKQIDTDGAFEYSKEIEVEIGAALVEFNLAQNYPNPFNPVTKIKFSLPLFSNGEVVSLRIYDVLGNEIATLVNEEKPAGIYEVEWNASGLSSGIYFYTLSSGDFISTKKLLLLK